MCFCCRECLANIDELEPSTIVEVFIFKGSQSEECKAWETKDNQHYSTGFWVPVRQYYGEKIEK